MLGNQLEPSWIVTLDCVDEPMQDDECNLINPDLATEQIMSYLSMLPDTELVNLLKNDSEPALRELYNRYWKRLYTFAYQRVRCKETAEEHVQEFLCKLWLNRENLYIEKNFEGFAYAGLRNILLDQYRKKSRFEKVKINLKHRFIESENPTDDWLAIQDLNTQLNAQMSALPEKCRSVFRLSRFQYLSNREIAHNLGISEKTVEGHLTKALKHLRQHLQQAMASISV